MRRGFPTIKEVKKEELDEKRNPDIKYNIRLYFKILKPILISHHPNCDKFNNHTFRIGRYKLCIGCFIGYPTAIIGILIIYFLNLVNIINGTFLFTVGVILIASFILSPLNLTKIKSIKIIQKFFIGIGTAFLFWWIFSLKNLWLINFLFFLAIFGPLLALLNGYHAYSFIKTCKKCKYSSNWRNCPGFEDFINYLNEKNLPIIF